MGAKGRTKRAGWRLILRKLAPFSKSILDGRPARQSIVQWHGTAHRSPAPMPEAFAKPRSPLTWGDFLSRFTITDLPLRGLKRVGRQHLGDARWIFFSLVLRRGIGAGRMAKAGRANQSYRHDKAWHGQGYAFSASSARGDSTCYVPGRRNFGCRA